MSPSWMPAVVVRETEGKGGWNRLSLERVPRPEPGPGEVLVQVEACSVNRADLLQRRGLYPPPAGASSILGLDFAGYVVQPSSRGKDRGGERVYGIVAGGGYGRYLVADESHLLTIPENLSFVEAAAAAEVFLTAYLNMFKEAEARNGESLLLHGGGSGVGTAAIQLGREASVEIFATAGSALKISRSLELGASRAINYKEEDFAARILDITGGAGIDVILDWIGAPYLSRHVELLKPGGRLVLMGLMGGHKAQIPLAPVLVKRLRLMGSVLRSRSRQEKTALISAFRKDVQPLLASGKVRPVVDSVYPVDAVEEAHQAMREDRHFGKLVLTWSREAA